MNKIELLQEKYNKKKNDMSKEELLEFNEHLFKSFMSDTKANDNIFWAYSEITDRVIEDLKEKNAQLIADNRLDNKGNRAYIEELYRHNFFNKNHLENAKKEIAKLESDLVKERSLSNQLSFQAESHERDVLFFSSEH